MECEILMIRDRDALVSEDDGGRKRRTYLNKNGQRRSACLHQC